MASSLKLVALLGLLAACGYASAASYETNEQTVIWGVQGPYDKLLYSEKVDVTKTILKVHNRDVRYPPHSTAAAGNISQIKVIDQLRTGKNAYVIIAKGGLGQREAVIHLKSKRGSPIRYLVEFYGSL